MKKYLPVYIKPLALAVALSIFFFVLPYANNHIYSNYSKLSSQPEKKSCTEKLQETDMQLVKVLPEKILQLLQ